MKRHKLAAVLTVGILTVLTAGIVVGTGGNALAAYLDTVKVESSEKITAKVPLRAFGTPHAAAVDTGAALVDGNVYLWGYFGAEDAGGPAGSGSNNRPTKVPGLSDVVSLAAYAYGYYALTGDGNLYTWGNNSSNASGGSRAFHLLDTQVTSISGGEYTGAYVKDDGTVWSVGNGAFGQRGVGGGVSSPAAPTKVLLPSGEEGLSVYGAYEGHYLLTKTGKILYWGRDFRGGAGFGTVCPAGDSVQGPFGVGAQGCHYGAPIEVPALTELYQSEGLVTLNGGYSYGALLTSNGNIYTWGSAERNGNGFGQPATSQVNGPTLLTTDALALSVSFLSARVLKKDGSVDAWGAYNWGGFGANTSDQYGKVYNGSKGRAIAVAGSKDFGMYTLEDGSLWGWGENGGYAASAGSQPGAIIWGPVKYPEFG